MLEYPPLVVFIDEVHLLPRGLQEALLTMLEAAIVRWCSPIRSVLCIELHFFSLRLVPPMLMRRLLADATKYNFESTPKQR